MQGRQLKTYQVKLNYYTAVKSANNKAIEKSIYDILISDIDLLEFRGQQGETLLHQAVLLDNMHLVIELIEQGLSPYVLDNQGNSALAMVGRGIKKTDSEKIYQYLKEPFLNQYTEIHFQHNDQFIVIPSQDYIYKRQIGQGTFGIVFQAKYIGNNQHFQDLCSKLRDKNGLNHHWFVIKLANVSSENLKGNINFIAEQSACDALRFAWLNDKSNLTNASPFNLGASAMLSYKKDNIVAYNQIIISQLECYSFEWHHRSLKPVSATAYHFFEKFQMAKLLHVLDRNKYLAIKDEIMFSIYESLFEMHKYGWVHLDVALRNVLISADSNGKLSGKLSDYGFSLYLAKSNKVIEDFNKDLPIRLMNDERIARKPISYAADLYSYRIAMLEEMAIDLNIPVNQIINLGGQTDNLFEFSQCLNKYNDTERLAIYLQNFSKFYPPPAMARKLACYSPFISNILKQPFDFILLLKSRDNFFLESVNAEVAKLHDLDNIAEIILFLNLFKHQTIYLEKIQSLYNKYKDVATPDSMLLKDTLHEYIVKYQSIKRLYETEIRYYELTDGYVQKYLTHVQHTINLLVKLLSKLTTTDIKLEAANLIKMAATWELVKFLHECEESIKNLDYFSLKSKRDNLVLSKATIDDLLIIHECNIFANCLSHYKQKLNQFTATEISALPRSSKEIMNKLDSFYLDFFRNEEVLAWNKVKERYAHEFSNLCSKISKAYSKYEKRREIAKGRKSYSQDTFKKSLELWRKVYELLSKYNNPNLHPINNFSIDRLKEDMKELWCKLGKRESLQLVWKKFISNNTDLANLSIFSNEETLNTNNKVIEAVPMPINKLTLSEKPNDKEIYNHTHTLYTPLPKRVHGHFNSYPDQMMKSSRQDPDQQVFVHDKIPTRPFTYNASQFAVIAKTNPSLPRNIEDDEVTTSTKLTRLKQNPGTTGLAHVATDNSLVAINPSLPGTQATELPPPPTSRFAQQNIGFFKRSSQQDTDNSMNVPHKANIYPEKNEEGLQMILTDIVENKLNGNMIHQILNQTKRYIKEINSIALLAKDPIQTDIEWLTLYITERMTQFTTHSDQLSYYLKNLEILHHYYQSFRSNHQGCYEMLTHINHHRCYNKLKIDIYAYTIYQLCDCFTIAEQTSMTLQIQLNNLHSISKYLESLITMSFQPTSAQRAK